MLSLAKESAAEPFAPLLHDREREAARKRAHCQNYLIQIALGVTSFVFGTLFIVFLVLHQNALSELKTKTANADFGQGADSKLALLAAQLNKLSSTGTAQLSPAAAKTDSFWSSLATRSGLE
jgi:hypothetical protein